MWGSESSQKEVLLIHANKLIQDKTYHWLNCFELPVHLCPFLRHLWPVISSGLCHSKWPCLPLAYVVPYLPYVHCLHSRESSIAWWYLEEPFSLLNKLSRTFPAPWIEFPRPQRLKTQLWNVIISSFTHSKVPHQKRSRENRFKNHWLGDRVPAAPLPFSNFRTKPRSLDWTLPLGWIVSLASIHQHLQVYSQKTHLLAPPHETRAWLCLALGIGNQLFSRKFFNY